MSETTHTPIPPELNSLPNFVARLRTHLARWPKGIVPIDSEDFKRLLDVAQQTYSGGAVRPQRAEDISPPPRAQS